MRSVGNTSSLPRLGCTHQAKKADQSIQRVGVRDTFRKSAVDDDVIKLSHGMELQAFEKRRLGVLGSNQKLTQGGKLLRCAQSRKVQALRLLQPAQR